MALVGKRSLELSLWFLVKLFIVGMILGLHVEIRDLAKETWYRTYEFSDQVWRMEGGVSEQLKDAVNDVQILLPTTFGLLGLLKTGGRNLTIRTASEGIESQMGREARKLLNWVPTLLNIMLYAIMPIIFIYGALIYLSGIQMLVFLVFFKLAAAFLMLPGGGLGMLRRLSAVYLAALIKVLWLPFMFGILIDLVLRQPMRRFGEHLQAGISKVNEAVKDLNARMPASVREALSPREWQDWLEAIPDTIMTGLGGVLTIMIGWILGFVMILILLGVGIWLMQQASGVITAMVGGFGGAGAIPNPVAQTVKMVQQRIYMNRLANREQHQLPPPSQRPSASGGRGSGELERRVGTGQQVVRESMRYRRIE